MTELLKQEILQHGDQAAIVPISRLHNIRQDIENLQGSGILNNFQQYIVNDLYLLDVPETPFEVRSILIVASSSPSSAKITFTWNGKRTPVMLPAAYVDNVTAPMDIEHYLNAFLNPRGHHVQYAPRLPRKLLAVRSGLGEYERNNLC